MPQERLWRTRAMEEKGMSITVVGLAIVIAVAIAVLLVVEAVTKKPDTPPQDVGCSELDGSPQNGDFLHLFP